MVVSVVGLVVMLVLGRIGWPGNPDLCVARGGCFCEQMQLGSPIVEPVNTWTNLFIIAGGLLVLLRLKSTPETASNKQPNPMTAPTFYSTLYGFIGISIGIGSTFYHASMTDWGEFLDVFSMNMLITFFFTYDLTRIFSWSLKRFLLLYIPLNLMSGFLIGFFPAYGTDIFTALVAVAALFDISILIATRRIQSLQWFHRDWRWFAFGLGLFTFGTFVWILSQSGGVLCDPTSWIQGHGFWHFADGAAILHPLHVFPNGEKDWILKHRITKMNRRKNRIIFPERKILNNLEGNFSCKIEVMTHDSHPRHWRKIQGRLSPSCSAYLHYSIGYHSHGWRRNHRD